jgi:hypothetical protein
LALNALGVPTDQGAFFDGRTGEIRSDWATFYFGATLDQLAAMLAAHDVAVEAIHAGDVSVETFRQQARGNLARTGDVVVVNYHRGSLGQGATGHFSPLGAYHAGSDQFLVLDVAAHKYPWTWIPTARLFDAMDTIDSSADTTRGYLLVRRD